MRVVILLLAAIAVLAWFAFELKDRQRDVAQILFALAALLAVLLVAAFFGLL